MRTQCDDPMTIFFLPSKSGFFSNYLLNIILNVKLNTQVVFLVTFSYEVSHHF